MTADSGWEACSFIEPLQIFVVLEQSSLKGERVFLPIFIIFLAGFLASLFGTLIGGSSLVTIPTLLLLGLPPHTAIGAYYSDRIGNVWIKRVFLVLLAILIIKLIV